MISFDSQMPILTSRDREQFISEIDLLLESLYETTNEKSYSFVVANNVRYSTKAFLESLGVSPDGSPSKVETVKTKLEELRAEILNLPLVRLTLAFTPTAKNLAEIIDVFRYKSKHFVIIELTVDPSIIGGCQVVWQGKVSDFSVRLKLDKWQENFKKQTISF